MSNEQTPIQKAAEDFIQSLTWSEDATDWEKTLVAGNVRGFAAKIAAAAPMPEEVRESLPEAEEAYQAVIDWIEKLKVQAVPHYAVALYGSDKCKAAINTLIGYRSYIRSLPAHEGGAKVWDAETIGGAPEGLYRIGRWHEKPKWNKGLSYTEWVGGEYLYPRVRELVLTGRPLRPHKGPSDFVNRAFGPIPQPPQEAV